MTSIKLAAKVLVNNSQHNLATNLFNRKFTEFSLATPKA